jgi:hypothetical protein
MSWWLRRITEQAVEKTNGNTDASSKIELLDNDGVHRVVAGGCPQNRKPAGRNLGFNLLFAVIYGPLSATVFRLAANRLSNVAISTLMPE